MTDDQVDDLSRTLYIMSPPHNASTHSLTRGDEGQLRAFILFAMDEISRWTTAKTFVRTNL